MATYLSHPSTASGPSPHYTDQDVELARLDSASPTVSTAPPPYDEAPASHSAFHPTVHLQIEAPGKPWLSLPGPTRPDPIPIFTLHPDDSSAATASTSTPTFISNRPERSSGSCYLVSASTPTTPLAATTYRFGPNRPARMRLYHPHTTPALPTAHLHALVKDEPVGGAADAEVEPWDDFPLTPLGLLTRALGFRTRLGTFEWRYASRKERHALAEKSGEEVSSLLVLERVVRVATALNQSSGGGGGGGKKGEEKVRTTVAHFLRGPGYRTSGSGASTAGNGGRLVMDLGMWEAEEGDKGEREMARVLVVATCLTMLKKEVDRRRAQQIAVIAGAVSG